MTGVVIRFEAMAGHVTDGATVPEKGAYLSGFDVDARDGRGDATFVTDPRAALVFAGFAQAHEAWMMTSTVLSTRPDGRPNRPLTAFSILVEPDPLGRDATYQPEET